MAHGIEDVTVGRRQLQTLQVKSGNRTKKESPKLCLSSFFFPLWCWFHFLRHCPAVGIWPLTLRPYSYSIGTTKKKKIRGLPDNFSQNNPGLGLCPGFAHVPKLGPVTVAREWGLRRTLVSMHVAEEGKKEC